MGFNRSGYHRFYFDYELERDGEYIPVEVTYAVDGDDLSLESVQHNHMEIDTTDAEDRAMLNYASERVQEDMIDAEADYGDYVNDIRAEWED